MSDDHSTADSPIRCISSRELSRRTAEVLAEVSRSSRPLMVVRHKRPVALLAPIPGGLFEPIVRQVVQAEEVNPEEVDRVAADELQSRILVLMADALPHVDVGRDLGETSVAPVSVALTKLEISCLVVRQPTGSYRISRRGALVAKALKSEEGSQS